MASKSSTHSIERWYVRHNEQIRGPYLSGEIRHQLVIGSLTLEDLISQDKEQWQSLLSVPEVIPPEMRAVEGDRSAKRLLEAREKQGGGDFQRRSMKGLWGPLSVLVGAAVAAVVIANWLWEPIVIGDPQCEAPPSPGVDWRYCRKNGANLANSDFTHANMSSVNLQGADLSEGTFESAILSYANLSDADLSYSEMNRANMKGADLQRAKLTYSNLESANLSFANLTGASLGGAKLENARLDNAIWLDGSECASGSVGKCLIIE